MPTPMQDELRQAQESNNFGDNAEELPQGTQTATQQPGDNQDPDNLVAQMMAERDPAKFFDINPAEEDPAPTETPTGEPESTGDKLPVVAKIGNKEFTSMEDAMKYANELHTARETDDAYIEGLKAGKNQTGLETQQTQTEIETPPGQDLLTTEEAAELEDLMLTDPAKYVRRLAEINRRNAQKLLDDREAERTRQAALQEQQTTWYNTLYSKYPDLAKDKEFTTGLLNQHMDKFSKLDSVKAIDVFGDFAMKKIRDFTSKFVPTQEFDNTKPVKVASVSTKQTTSKPVNENTEKIDFISQIRNNSKVSGIRGE